MAWNLDRSIRRASKATRWIDGIDDRQRRWPTPVLRVTTAPTLVCAQAVCALPQRAIFSIRQPSHGLPLSFPGLRYSVRRGALVAVLLRITAGPREEGGTIIRRNAQSSTSTTPRSVDALSSLTCGQSAAEVRWIEWVIASAQEARSDGPR